MTTALVTAKSTGLVKTGRPMRQLAARVERARQSFNETVARAEAKYYETIRQAVAAVSEMQVEAPADQSTEANIH